MLINMDNCIPRPPALPPGPLHSFKSNHANSDNSQGFRLLSDQDDRDSVYSIYKQKIDQMFESDSSTNTKNSVQAKIEKMFTDVARDNGILVKNEIGQHNFSVDYLGSVPLHEKVTSLGGLQKPLKDLYFAYKKITKQKKLLTGRLEISSVGLKVQYQGEKGDLEQLNSFPTIAVWSAVKFVIDEKKNYAFLPLITDPDNIDKKALFRKLDDSEDKYITTEAHSPLFAVVMRKIGVHKQLECHGFVCQTSEDAIVVAATLYKSLMAHMKAKEKKPKSKNGITCMSIASSTPEKKQSPQIPERPPRKKRSTASSVTSNGDQDLGDNDTQPLLPKPLKKSIKKKRAPKAPESPKKDDFDAILPYEDPIKTQEEEIKPKSFSEKLNAYMSKEQKEITKEIKQVLSTKQEELARNNSKKENSGDILTKVTIPRSGSFLNAGGLTRYKSKVSRSNGKATGGSPLGFNELFNEFRLQEGLHSMDEILGVIIDPEGMSFNDLKPIYKEFLLKLSVTLTKDELFQRSKLIMRRHRKKMLKRSQPQKHLPIGSKFKRLKHIFQRNIKLRLSKVNRKPLKEPQPQKNQLKPESSISTSSYDTRHFTPKIETKSKKKLESTSEDSDFFSMRRKSKMNSMNQNRNSSSGYVSCSECSYDSDTCTCISADKCYCSLGNGQKRTLFQQQKDFSDPVFCGCDTDSCAESNKCYCQRVDHNRHKKLCKKNSHTKSSRSLEYMHNPSESYYEKLNQRRRRFSDNTGLDYDLFNIQNRAIYARALSERQVASMRSYGSAKYSIKSGRSLKAVAAAAPPLEALSVKKSAEIAALFADIKLSQTTDISHLKHTGDHRNCSRLKNPDIKAISQYPHQSRVVQNSLYRSSKTLYNTRNGLYTIQSQSDESRRSSLSDKKKRATREFFGSGGGQNLENSLGYLP